MNKMVITTIVTLCFCFSAFAQEAKGKDWTEEEWKKEKRSYGWVFPHIDKNADGTVTAAEYEAFQEFKQQHPNWEIELNPSAKPKEFQAATQMAQAANARAIPTFDPGWEDDEFPPHAVSLKTPEEIMAIYKRGEAGRT